MTRKLEEELGLPHMDDIEDMSCPDELGKFEAESAELVESLSTAEKLDYALSTVKGVDGHDAEMNEISTKAIKSHDELIELGKNMPAANTGRVYEVAGQMLKYALDARNSKADRKLKMLELQLKKLKIEKDAGEGGGPTKGDELDRNELLSLIRSSNKLEEEKTSDK
jgi:hypothetical protein